MVEVQGFIIAKTSENDKSICSEKVGLQIVFEFKLTKVAKKIILLSFEIWIWFKKENAHHKVCVSIWRCWPDLNWRITVLQTGALPLGYSTI